MRRTGILAVWTPLLVWALAMGASGQTPTRRQPSIYQYGPMDGVDPDRTAPEGTTYKTFHSKTINLNPAS